MPLETPQALPLMLVHGTFWQHWPSILLKGLSRGGRTHIHLAPGLPGDPGVISGQCLPSGYAHLLCPPRVPPKGLSLFCPRPCSSTLFSPLSPGAQPARFNNCNPRHPKPQLIVSAGMRPNCEVAVFINGPLALAGESGHSRDRPRPSERA